MTNSFFNASGAPATGSPGASATIRAEFSSIASAFDKMPALTASRAVVVNAGGTGLTVTTGTFALAGNFSTTGAFNTVLAQQASVTLTLPATNGTLATLAGTESLSNKTFVAPALGTPVSGTLTSCTGLPLTTGVTGTLAVANGGTGGTTSTGSGAVVLATGPTITTLTASGTTTFAGNTTITSSGNLGVKTTTPTSATFVVNAAAADAIELLSTSNNNWKLGPNSGAGAGFGIYDETATATRVKIDLSGNVGIGTTSPSSTLHVVGTANITGAVTLGSTINKVTITAPASGSTLTIADGKTLTVSNDATISGTHSGTSSGTNSGDQTITLQGDVTGTGTGTFTTTLKNTGPGAGSYTLASITLDAQGRVTAASNGTGVTAGQLPGLTSGSNPGTGYIGQILTNNALNVSLGSGAAKTVVSLSLTAGVWDVSGDVLFSASSVNTTAGQRVSAQVSTSADTVNGNAELGGCVMVPLPALTSFSNSIATVPVAPKRFTVSTTTTVYLCGSAESTAGTWACWGYIQATRVG